MYIYIYIYNTLQYILSGDLNHFTCSILSGNLQSTKIGSRIYAAARAKLHLSEVQLPVAGRRWKTDSLVTSCYIITRYY